ncbi:hypothetical protein OU798_19500 [Prolixibacteraceae bacterium Z1-6]|uniref:DUF5056 domain-containing protein n=1 Tax=Draconibacterium aestuarii TaxID=2998507 RepID=A0A9X3F8X5_9BACT|nr:hypothetical protein [Prolixibacteraceae bacterium Z1-6]
MNELEDIKLQAFLKKLELDSPKPDFTVRVMNKIFEESNALERIKSEKILGKGFWIFMILFVVLFAAIFILYNTGAQPDSQLPNLLPEVSQGIGEKYDSFFSKLAGAPLAIGGILAAFSVLLFLDRIIISNSKIFA